MKPSRLLSLAFPPLAVVLLALGGTSAWAQTTIDQNKALAGNVTPGDAPGFPITISRAGSYKLTGNLTVPAGSHGIEVTANNVTLDLNGFTISGAGSCTRDDASQIVTCVGGTGYGILAPNGEHFALLNGSIRGFSIGLAHSGSGRVADLSVTQNHGIGFTAAHSLDGNLVIDRVVASLNAQSGLLIGKALLRGVVATHNGTHGIDGGSWALTRISDSQAMSNRMRGITAGLIQGVQMWQNGQPGRSGLVSVGGNVDDDGVF